MRHRRHSAEKGPHAKAMTMASRREIPRLYLVTPPLGDPGAIADDLAAALNAADIAAVLVRLAEGEERELVARIEGLRILIQSNGAALLLDGHPELVARDPGRWRASERDRGPQGRGTHSQAERHRRLRRHLPRATTRCSPVRRARIMSCSGSRIATDAGPRFEAVLERVGWWAEVMTIPCVGYAARLEEIAPLVQAGAEFVAIGDNIWRGQMRAAIDALTRTPEPVR